MGDVRELVTRLRATLWVFCQAFNTNRLTDEQRKEMYATLQGADAFLAQPAVGGEGDAERAAYRWAAEQVRAYYRGEALLNPDDIAAGPAQPAPETGATPAAPAPDPAVPHAPGCIVNRNPWYPCDCTPALGGEDGGR